MCVCVCVCVCVYICFYNIEKEYGENILNKIFNDIFIYCKVSYRISVFKQFHHKPQDVYHRTSYTHKTVHRAGA